MNYYEELGVSRSASIAEIRQAYKALVRVLHPDQQQEEDLRRVSELQLRRLNHMLQVLLDPAQRRQYDLSLDRLLPVVVPAEARQKFALSEFRGVRVKVRFHAGALVWVLIAAILIATGIFWIRAPEPVYSEPVRASKERPVEQTQKSTPLPELADSDRRTEDHTQSASNAHALTIEAPAPARTYPNARHAVEKPRPAIQQQSAYSTRPATTKTSRNDNSATPVMTPAAEPLRAGPPTGTPPVLAPVSLPPANPRNSDHSISGEWLYAPQHDDTKKGMYPPEYIEMRITRRAGLLQGRYHAKYRVNDRPISSEVNFRFEGRQGDNVSVMPWFGSNGSRGELRLKRISDDSLEVNWVTTSFGTANTLASGTAVLYRSDAP